VPQWLTPVWPREQLPWDVIDTMRIPPVPREAWSLSSS